MSPRLVLSQPSLRLKTDIKVEPPIPGLSASPLSAQGANALLLARARRSLGVLPNKRLRKRFHGVFCSPAC